MHQFLSTIEQSLMTIASLLKHVEILMTVVFITRFNANIYLAA